MTRPAGLGVVCVAAALVAGCGAAHSKTAKTTPVSAQSQRVYVGEVGVLPAPTRATNGRPRLVVPLDALTVPGRFPLSSVVSFNVPIRNDGTRPLRIERLDPG